MLEQMKQNTYKDAVLARDVPEHRLKRGDIVKLVDHHIVHDVTEGYSIEVFNAVGDTIAVTSLPATALEPLREDQILLHPVGQQLATIEERQRLVSRSEASCLVGSACFADS